MLVCMRGVWEAAPYEKRGYIYPNRVLITGVWGNAPIGFPEGENRHRPGPAGGTGLGIDIPM